MENIKAKQGYDFARVKRYIRMRIQQRMRADGFIKKGGAKDIIADAVDRMVEKGWIVEPSKKQ